MFSKEATVSDIYHFVFNTSISRHFLAEECCEVTQRGLGEELGPEEEKERLQVEKRNKNSHLLVKHPVYRNPYYDH